MKSQTSKLRINELANKITEGTITPLEQEEFDKWYSHQMTNTFRVPKHIAKSQIELKSRIFQHIEYELGFSNKTKYTSILRKLAVAASILLMIATGAYFVIRQHNQVNPEIVQHSIPNLAPGQSKAILTLSSGKKIILDDAHQGDLAAEGNSVIKKTAERGVIYADSHSHHTSNGMVNTMSTPRGGEYQLTLADGTKVWLNAASSITYPVAFTGKYRDVSVTGEAYFEVAHDSSKPFRVKTGSQIVEVLGTHFNINGYNDEKAIRTTLLEGSVSISSNNIRKMLRPGEQASFIRGTLNIQTVDIEEAIAWKNGYFQFVDTDIKTIMRQLARWYDVDVEFDGEATKETFTGRISRHRNLNQVLAIVKGSKSVNLSFEGRRIMVRQ